MPNGNSAPGPLNSRYFRPVRRKETRARRWDLQFESTSLQPRSQERTADRKEVDLALDPGDLRQRLAKIRLHMALIAAALNEHRV